MQAGKELSTDSYKEGLRLENPPGRMVHPTLGNLLKVNSSLKVIDISHNRITWAGAPLLCKGLKVNETLEVLRVSRRTRFVVLFVIVRVFCSKINSCIFLIYCSFSHY